MSNNRSHGTITSTRASWWQRLTRRSTAQGTVLDDISADLLALRTAADSRDGVQADLLTVMEDIRDDLRAIRNHIETRSEVHR
ncbi:hypothetical protein [Nocardia sp. NPDC059228]|uniref:hypothetical protein n=1 Tax=Nocardia sp. NPDC059228 TaxID=3346777 RepID=UPI0036B63444